MEFVPFRRLAGSHCRQLETCRQENEINSLWIGPAVTGVGRLTRAPGDIGFFLVSWHFVV